MLLPCSLHLSLSLCVCAGAPVCVSYVCLYRGKMAEKIADSWRYAHYFELQSEKDKKNIVVVLSTFFSYVSTITLVINRLKVAYVIVMNVGL